MASLADRLAALLMRRHDDIGLLRTRFEVHGWAQRLPRLGCGNAEDGARGVFMGRVRASSGTVLAPATLSPCVAFRVQRFAGEGDARDRASVLEMESSIEFELEDDTGRALVRPRLFSLHLPIAHTLVAGFVCDSASELREQVERRRQQNPGWSGESSLIANVFYQECRLTEGDPIAIIGAAKGEVGDSDDMRGAGYRDAPRRVVIEAAADAMFMYVTDWE